MLSRIAESLYWIGRYVERAEDTARILDVSCTSCSRTPRSTRTPPAGRCSRVLGVAAAARASRSTCGR